MFRTLFTLSIAFVATLVVAPTVTVISLFDSHSRLIDPLIRRWARLIVAAAGIRLVTEGIERLDPQERYVVVANHYSYLDIPCLFAALERPVRFMAKKSLFQVPVFGWGLKAAGFIPIDRNDRRTAIQSFDLAARRIRRGNSIVIFPEEGRTSTRELKPFQRGAFLLALRAGLPVVPVAIDGTFDVLPVGGRAIRPGVVTVRIADPITTKGRGPAAKEQLSTAARSAIRRMLGLPPEQPSAPASSSHEDSPEDELT